ncbi:MAG: response regulator [Betaproteobacteria bacterium]|nr:response regulator [Betaproteobacteria bacterium]
MAKILIVDDDEGMTDLLKIHLKREGMTIETAPDAAVALRSIINNPPDLIVLDIEMPYMGGLEVLRVLKSDPATSRKPVIVLTSRTDDECFSEAKSLGADAFLNKPVTREKLLGEVSLRLAMSLSAPR